MSLESYLGASQRYARMRYHPGHDSVDEVFVDKPVLYNQNLRQREKGEDRYELGWYHV